MAGSKVIAAAAPGLKAPVATAPGPIATAVPAPAPAAAVATGASDGKLALALAQKNACVACHAMDAKLIGPSFSAIAKKHAGKEEYLAGKIKGGGAGVWGAIPMPPQSLSEAEAKTIAAWLAAGAGK